MMSLEQGNGRAQPRLVTPGGLPVERADFSVDHVVVFDLAHDSWIRVKRSRKCSNKGA